MTKHHHSSSSHGSLGSYIVGFILSILLTIVPYMIVVNHVISLDAVAISIVILGIVQLFIQLKFFLHLNLSTPDGKANTLSFAFIFLVLIILVAGSLWIMWNMNYNMMGHGN